jgi:hypothetical protein
VISGKSTHSPVPTPFPKAALGSLFSYCVINSHFSWSSFKEALRTWNHIFPRVLMCKFSSLKHKVSWLQPSIGWGQRMQLFNMTRKRTSASCCYLAQVSHDGLLSVRMSCSPKTYPPSWLCKLPEIVMVNIHRTAPWTSHNHLPHLQNTVNTSPPWPGGSFSSSAWQQLQVRGSAIPVMGRRYSRKWDWHTLSPLHRCPHSGPAGAA